MIEHRCLWPGCFQPATMHMTFKKLGNHKIGSTLDLCSRHFEFTGLKRNLVQAQLWSVMFPDDQPTGEIPKINE